ncbi:type II toxin-antitoxin system VapC family toxin [Mucilaginibacter sp.]|uniref:type II toxin-antitoxin system VapC family toxin n=1 Tax=Mucilaginibacter sp. TaxID=1882438 RepID=UPI0032676E4D
MKFLFDTNILFHITKDQRSNLLQKINPEGNKVFISIATIAELRSLSLQNNWNVRRLDIIDLLLEEIVVVDINENLIDTYAQIDAYSQCRNPSFTTFPHKTPRNMGKNDLWIASTAALLGLTLITTDSDFDHLNNVFFDVRKIKPVELKVQ